MEVLQPLAVLDVGLAILQDARGEVVRVASFSALQIFAPEGLFRSLSRCIHRRFSLATKRATALDAPYYS